MKNIFKGGCVPFNRLPKRKGKAEANNTDNLTCLLIRNIPFILSRTDISDQALPMFGKYDMDFGLKNNMVSVKTFGAFARLHANFAGRRCPRCGNETYFIGAGGSIVSGNGKFSKWFCPSCKDAVTSIPNHLADLFNDIKVALSREAFVLPYFQAMCPASGRGAQTAEKTGELVAGISETASDTLGALEKIEAFDRLARGIVGMEHVASVTFCLLKGQTSHFVRFSNESGRPALSGNTAGENGIPVAWDEFLGLMPALRRCASGTGNEPQPTAMEDCGRRTDRR